MEKEGNKEVKEKNGSREGMVVNGDNRTSCKSTDAESKMDESISDPTCPIEDQLKNLPEFASDDEKPVVKKDQSPVIKKEPGAFCILNVNNLLEESKGAYNHCDIHKMDRMEKNVMCLQCEKLICALCLLNSHQAHEIRSVSSLKEYFKVKDLMEEDVSILQQQQNSLTVQFSQRKDLKKKIEESSKILALEIEKSFKVIKDILQAKQEQLLNYIRQFESVNIAELNKDIDMIRDLENSASRMITRSISFFSKIDMQEASDLPPRLREVIQNCKEANVQSLENKEKYLPERKFSKLLPSLDAVANICQTIHAEATKVVWSKTTKNSETDDKKAARLKVEKRKHNSHSDHPDNSKTFKKPKISASASSASSMTSPLPALVAPHRRSSTEDTDKNKKNIDKSLFESLTENLNNTNILPGSKLSQTRKSVDSVSQSPRLGSDIDDSESDRSETSSSITPPNLKLVEMRATNIETGKCLMAKLFEDDGDKIVLGKVVESSKMKDTTQYTVNWLKGELGKDTLFEIRKKQNPVHSSSVICNFEFDYSKAMSPELKNELIMAKEYHCNRKKTRKRKSIQPKDKSPKKDSNKTSTSKK